MWKYDIKKLFTKTVIGISIEEEVVKIIHVAKEKKRLRVLASPQVACSSKEDVCSSVKALMGDLPAPLVTGLELQDVMIRSIFLPLRAKHKVLRALPFQLEGLLPFPSEEIVVRPFLQSVDSKTTSVYVIATCREMLKKHLEEMASLHIQPDAITATVQALFRLAKWLYPQRQDLLLFHLREQKTDCVLIKEDRIVLSQSLRFGKRDFIDPSNQEAVTHELERFSIFMQEKTQTIESIPWLLLGEGAEPLEPLLKRIFSDVQLPVQTQEGIASEVFHTHCLAFGFALDALASDGKSVQWLQKQLTPAHHLKVRKKRLGIYTAACLILTAIIGGNTSWSLQRKTSQLCNKWHALLATAPAKQRTLSISEIEQELAKSEAALLKQKNSSSFYLTVPNVSEVLAWVSTHPALASADGLSKEGIDIKHIHYQLLKFPTLDAPATPYLAQVELEFTATIPRLAREFHDLLLKGDRIVNAKKDLKWNTHGNTYTVQFELNKSSL